MEVGEPSAPPPRRVREAAIAALGGQPVGYTDALGLVSCASASPAIIASSYGVAVDPARMATTTGSSGGFVMAFWLCSIRARGWRSRTPAIRPIAIFSARSGWSGRFADRFVQHFAVTAAAVEQADAARKLDGLLLMSPANPTGAMQSADLLREIAAICERRGIKFISDEIYHGLTYDRPAQTALAFSDRAVIVNSFSKYYCMTGWRIGWLVVPPELPRVVERLQQSLAISAPTLSQIAAEAAFDAGDELEAVKAGYRRNRDLLLDGLPSLGLDQLAPADGAFYIYADVSRFTDDSTALRHELLHRAGWRRPLASISIRIAARAPCACPMPAPKPTSSKPWKRLKGFLRRWDKESCGLPERSIAQRLRLGFPWELVREIPREIVAGASKFLVRTFGFPAFPAEPEVWRPSCLAKKARLDRQTGKTRRIS